MPDPTPDLIRIEVTDQHGTVTQIIDVSTLQQLKPRKRQHLDNLTAELVSQLTTVLGTDQDHARQVAVADLTRIVADDQAYERVAARRGLLAPMTSFERWPPGI